MELALALTESTTSTLCGSGGSFIVLERKCTVIEHLISHISIYTIDCLDVVYQFYSISWASALIDGFQIPMQKVLASLISSGPCGLASC